MILIIRIMDSYQTFDVERLLETSGDDRSLAVELLSLYLELTGKELDRLQIVASIGDNKSIHSIAHKCAGSSITCGMQELADILRELEYASVESV
ncbi:MAG: hypothetical protein FJ220_06470, partial [Kiritimatiellaceae bacterium]|nr:hypothetical protein [Kiritimatiellaceae bacterium]